MAAVNKKLKFVVLELITQLIEVSIASLLQVLASKQSVSWFRGINQ